MQIEADINDLLDDNISLKSPIEMQEVEEMKLMISQIEAGVDAMQIILLVILIF